MAMYGGFISHYWQNTLTGYHDWNDNLSYGYIADGRGDTEIIMTSRIQRIIYKYK